MFGSAASCSLRFGTQRHRRNSKSRLESMRGKIGAGFPHPSALGSEGEGSTGCTHQTIGARHSTMSRTRCRWLCGNRGIWFAPEAQRVAARPAPRPRESCAIRPRPGVAISQPHAATEGRFLQDEGTARLSTRPGRRAWPCFSAAGKKKKMISTSRARRMSALLSAQTATSGAMQVCFRA